MALPLPWVKTDDLMSFDGVVWFRTEVELSAPVGALTLGLSGIYDSDIAWVNGVEVGRTENGYGALRTYTVPSRVLNTGRNVIAIRVDDPRGRGGFWGEADDMYLRGPDVDISLATLWQYKVEEEYVGGKKSEFSSREPLAAQFARLLSAGESTLESADERVVALSVLPGELRYDRPSFTVAAGERVRVRFTNPGDVPHNVVITEPGGVDVIGGFVGCQSRRTIRSGCRGDIVFHRDGGCRRGDGASFYGPKRAWKLSVCVHVPRALAPDAGGHDCPVIPELSTGCELIRY